MGNITSEDLLKLEAKMKDADTKDRHEINGNIQKYVYNMEELKTTQALYNQQQGAMKEKIDSIEKKIDTGFEKVAQSFEKLPNHFATKEEHRTNITKIENNDKRLAKFEKGFWWLLALVASAIVGGILKLIIIV